MSATQLKSHDVFQYLRPEQVDAISSAAEEIAPKAGTFVFLQGEPAEDFYVVLEGQVRLRLPRPDLSVETGTPNACTDCHAERGASWATAEIARRFSDTDRRSGGPSSSAAFR